MSSNLRIRKDDFSVQYMHSADDMFYVRLDQSRSNREKLVFSDFKIAPEQLAEAQEILAQLVDRERRTLDIIVLDILPERGGEVDRAAVVSRHDLVVDVLAKAMGPLGYEKSNAFLAPRDGKFDTVIRFEVS